MNNLLELIKNNTAKISSGTKPIEIVIKIRMDKYKHVSTITKCEKKKPQKVILIDPNTKKKRVIRSNKGNTGGRFYGEAKLLKK